MADATHPSGELRPSSPHVSHAWPSLVRYLPLLPARPEPGKLSVLRRPDPNKPAAEPPRQRRPPVVDGLCVRSGQRQTSKVEAGVHANQCLAMGFAELMLTDLAGAPRTNGGPVCSAPGGKSPTEVPTATFARPGDPGRNRPLHGPAAVSDFVRSATPGCRKATRPQGHKRRPGRSGRSAAAGQPQKMRGRS